MSKVCPANGEALIENRACTRAPMALAFALSIPLLASPASAQNCGRWEGMPELVGLEVVAFTEFDDGTGNALYVGGAFANAGGVTVNRIAKWDGANWSALIGPNGTGVNNSVWAMTVFDDGSGPALYAGGTFTTAGGGVTVNRIAKWDGKEWSALTGPEGTGVSHNVRDLKVFDDGSGPALYAVGHFTSAGGVEANRIARWDGVAWSGITTPGGNGLSGTSTPNAYALAVFDAGDGAALYAAGSFTSAGGVPANRVARWDGTNWAALPGPSGNGVNSTPYSLAGTAAGTVPALVIGGQFTSVGGGIAANRIARWDGVNWSAYSGPNGNGMSSNVYAFTDFDDGSGPALYAGGTFTSAGGVTANRIARWDGANWSALSDPNGNGMNSGYVTALIGHDDGSGPALYAGGTFVSAGGVTANRIARWRPRPPCPADLTHDCLLDLSDIQSFAAAFLGSDPLADLAEPFGVLDLADVSAFVQSFQSGCQ